jgi:raffinose/stachyose/melibiose transport system permease protein
MTARTRAAGGRRRGGGTVVSRAERLTGYTILVVFTVIAVFPLAAIVVQALQPPGFDLSGFATAWRQGHLGTYLVNSVIVAGVVVPAAALLSILAGYALGTMRFTGATPLFYVFLLGLMVPTETIVVPLLVNLRATQLDNTYAGLILPQIAQSVSFGTFWMRAYFRAVPRSLIEAARVDGASSWTTLWRILVPVGRPAIVTMVVLVFMWTWNEFLLALMIINSADDLRTAPLGLSFFQGQHQTDYALLMAGALIVALPVVVVYVFLQRHFIAGMLSGALKE